MTTNGDARVNGIAVRTGWAFLFVGAMFTTLIVSRYLTFNPEVYFPEQRETYLDHRAGLYLHVIGGMLAMMVGPFQFIAGLRSRYLSLHRWLGRIYLTGSATGGAAGLYMAQFAYGGFPARIGFALLAAAWLTCGFMALQRVLTGRIAAHREWMIRSFALTLAAFSLRMWLLGHGILSGMEAISLPYVEMYTAVAWLCWVPNLVLAECYVNSSRSGAPAR